jgi:hypothetical protein
MSDPPTGSGDHLVDLHGGYTTKRGTADAMQAALE